MIACLIVLEALGYVGIVAGGLWWVHLKTVGR